MRTEPQPDIDGVVVRSFGITRYEGVSLVINLWAWRIAWRPWWWAITEDTDETP